MSNTKEGINVSTSEIEVIGRDTMIRFMANDQQIRALVESDSVRDKDEIILTVPEDRVHLFEMETELIIDVYEKLTEEEKEEARELVLYFRGLEEELTQQHKIEQDEKDLKTMEKGKAKKGDE